MALQSDDFERFLAGEMAPDDGAWPEATELAGTLNASFPSPYGPTDATQVAAAVAGAREIQLDAARRRTPSGARRMPKLGLAVFAVAALTLTAGVGMASALNGSLTPQSSQLDVMVVPLEAGLDEPPVPTMTPSAEETEEAEKAEPVRHTVRKPAVAPHRSKPKAKPAPKQESHEAEHEDDHEDHEDHEDDED